MKTNKRKAFTRAHSMTRKTLAKFPGADYRATFAAALSYAMQRELQAARRIASIEAKKIAAEKNERISLMMSNPTSLRIKMLKENSVELQLLEKLEEERIGRLYEEKPRAIIESLFIEHIINKM